MTCLFSHVFPVSQLPCLPLSFRWPNSSLSFSLLLKMPPPLPRNVFSSSKILRKRKIVCSVGLSLPKNKYNLRMFVAQADVLWRLWKVLEFISSFYAFGFEVSKVMAQHKPDMYVLWKKHTDSIWMLKQLSHFFWKHISKNNGGCYYKTEETPYTCHCMHAQLTFRSQFLPPRWVLDAGH